MKSQSIRSSCTDVRYYFSMTCPSERAAYGLLSPPANNQLDRQSSALVGRSLTLIRIFSACSRRRVACGPSSRGSRQPLASEMAGLARISVCIDDDVCLLSGRLVVVDKSRDRLRLIAFELKLFIAEPTVSRGASGGARWRYAGLRLAAVISIVWVCRRRQRHAELGGRGRLTGGIGLRGIRAERFSQAIDLLEHGLGQLLMSE